MTKRKFLNFTAAILNILTLVLICLPGLFVVSTTTEEATTQTPIYVWQSTVVLPIVIAVFYVVLIGLFIARAFKNKEGINSCLLTFSILLLVFIALDVFVIFAQGVAMVFGSIFGSVFVSVFTKTPHAALTVISPTGLGMFVLFASIIVGITSIVLASVGMKKKKKQIKKEMTQIKFTMQQVMLFQKKKHLKVGTLNMFGQHMKTQLLLISIMKQQLLKL